MNADQIALQLYTVRERTSRDLATALGEVARVGYRAVEFYGFGQIPTAGLRGMLDDLGLRAASAHVVCEDFDERPAAILAALNGIGCGYAVVPILSNEQRGGAEQAKQLAQTFNRWGALCRSEGVAFGYHNHAFEFAPIQDNGATTTLYDVLLAETDPSLVQFEFDVYWASVAGRDPIEMIRREGARMPLLHLKDMAGDGSRADRPLGEGVIAWAPMLVAADAATRWFIVEQDHPLDDLADIAASLRCLQGLAAT